MFYHVFSTGRTVFFHQGFFYLYCATGQKFRHQLIWMVCYSRRTYWLPGDAERRSPAPSAAGAGGVGRLPTDTPSRYATGGRLTMRAGDAAILRRLAHSGNSAGSAGSPGTAKQHLGELVPMTQKSQVNVVVVDTVCGSGLGALQDNAEHPSRNDITDNSVL